MSRGQRRALLVGINNYDNTTTLAGCVNDASSIKDVLERHLTADNSLNYDCITLLADKTDTVSRAALREALNDLFLFSGEILFFFSGHGYLSTAGGGYLCTSDAKKNDWGIPMQELVDLANRSSAQEIVILLDCCHSGELGNPPSINLQSERSPLTLLRENVTIMAASLSTQVSLESGGHGLFSQALIDALNGGAADHFGEISTASIYAYVDRRFGAWQQRPVYKAHSSKMNVLRKVQPLIATADLLQIKELFSSPDYKYPMDPEYEPEDEHGNKHEPVNEAKFEITRLFKKYRDAGLLKSSDSTLQLYWVARTSSTVELTPKGRECWWLVANKKI